MANERRLIDANALKKMFDEREADDIELYGCHIVECFPADDAKEIVDKAPTVDAVEMVHGRWQNWHYDPCEDCYVHVCSKCGGTNERMKPYCPNCGAKMDGWNSNV